MYVVGLAMDYCVGITALRADQEGFEVCIIKDATKSVAEDSHRVMMEDLKRTSVRILSSDAYFGKSRTNNFF